MSLFLKRLMWLVVDSIAWFVSISRKPGADCRVRMAVPRCSYRSAGGSYPLVTRTDNIVLSNGQMILPEIVTPYNFNQGAGKNGCGTAQPR